MPELSRRHVLALIPATGLLTVGLPLRALADEQADRARLLTNTVAILAGTAEVNQRPEAAVKLAAIQDTARAYLTQMDQAGPSELFAGVPLGENDANITQSYNRLLQIAVATRTDGVESELVGNTDVQRRVIDGLDWLHENYVGDQAAGYYGNWHNWEIGFPSHATRTLVLLADQVASYRPDLVGTYVATMDAYLRNGIDGDVDLDSRFHTGANLADITTNRFLQGALLGDDARISKAIADQSTVFATIDPYHLEHGNTDGYYADGSFIQHHSVAYTGSYGKVLLGRIAQTIKMLDGATSAGGDALVAVVQAWVTNGFAPLIFEGWMMEVVKGRAVSRTTTGYVDVRAVAEAVVDLAGYAVGDDATAIKGYVKFLNDSSPVSLNPDSFASPVSVVRFADIVADETVPAADLNAAARNVAFNAMDKTVHRRPGYAFALARSSDRISKYEYMNGENLMPWFQGDGAHYLYLAGQDQTRAFGVDYFTAVSPYRLSGVTAPDGERRTIPDLYGQFWYENPDHPLAFTSSSESQNTYVYFPRGTNQVSGGASLGAYGTAALVLSDDVAHVDKQAGVLPEDFVTYPNARATKSWFMLDDEIVVLAAGIAGGAGRGAVTTLDSRIADPADGVEVTGALADGAAWTGDGVAPLAWVRWENPGEQAAVGYVLLDSQEVTVELERVTRSRRVVRASNPNTSVTKDVFSVSVDHAADGAHALAYALVPNAGPDQLAGYSGGPLQVLANTTDIQAIKQAQLGIVAANTFTDGRHQAERLTVDGPAAVVLRQQGRRLEIGVSDPTMGREEVTLVIRGRNRGLLSADDGVTVGQVTGGTSIVVNTAQAYGRTFTAVLEV
ncbi:silent information regulator protein Sir2 [Occultella glacieicola]|uniref:Silent information regulator protein Sir2 n=1 Tax=Occultella glacieicola TaxID=2518684 RepID=A0ABY2EA37_9MICO|nr:polysaccharide lyase family 8 super-sandwich domain-containing protein [Occultella glacieicola]TDE98815.1 silent information regulator protein Sir2 [Occultella glacieicola]